MNKQSEYEVYHSTEKLLSLQKRKDELCCDDELSFQTVPQICELHFKIVLQHLENAKESMENNKLFEAINYLKRASEHIELSTMATHLLTYLKPIDFQKIRLELGNGSGQDSPGFKLIRKHGPRLWEPFLKLLKYHSETIMSLHRYPENNLQLYSVMQELMT